MMKVLVTGATGRVGQLLVPMLLEQGHQVRTIQRGNTSSTADWADKVEAVTGTISDRSTVDKAMQGIDVVCHLAALMPPFTDDELLSANLIGTYNILESIRDTKPSARLVHVSTDAIYGTGFSQRTYPTTIAETTLPEPTNFYGITKVLCEDLVAHGARQFEIDYVMLRFSWVFSSHEILDLFSMPMWLDAMAPAQKAELTGSDAIPVLLEEDGSPFYEHVVDSRDAAKACLLAINSKVTGEIFNVCGPRSFTYVEMSKLVAEKLGRTTVNVPLPSFHSYTFDLTKSRNLLKYEPDHSIESVVVEALAAR
jgi:nucleoside-diphosphate-sugar epimerase